MMKEKADKKESAKKSEKVDKLKEFEAKVEELETKCDELEAKVQVSESKAAESNDKYIRMAAEFDNYRRRTAKEKLELVSTAGEDVIKGLLPILDDCERALNMLKEANSDTSAIEGTELILNKLFGYLKTKGVEKIDALGKDLDTDFHEAVAQFPIEDPEKKNKIIDVVQQGYMLHEKVIRYAKVVVGV
jgi:molecular chaperone GrpE